VTRPVDVLQGTLDMLILMAVSLGPLHGLGGAAAHQSRFRKTAWRFKRGSLYPALYRLEHQGWIASEWGESENKKKAKY